MLTNALRNHAHRALGFKRVKPALSYIRIHVSLVEIIGVAIDDREYLEL